MFTFVHILAQKQLMVAGFSLPDAAVIRRTELVNLVPRQNAPSLGAQPLPLSTTQQGSRETGEANIDGQNQSNGSPRRIPAKGSAYEHHGTRIEPTMGRRSGEVGAKWH